ncbi:MAG: hypothetical protein EAZ92_06430 [Candidatus Kapaibacterium sp.]|nr:MAG: hypothetical protein EAZ92_06430 [Candidatus Kapabacteria bacterium]
MNYDFYDYQIALKTMKVLLSYLFFLTFAAAPLLAKAQAASAAQKDSTARRVLSYAQFVKEMVECTKDVYVLKNAELVLDENTDTAYTKLIKTEQGFDIQENGEPRNYATTVIKARVELSNIKIKRGITFYNFQFQGGMDIRDSVAGQWEFRDCIFYPIKFRVDVAGGAIEVSSCINLDLHFYRCIFTNKIQMYYCKLNELVFRGCKLYIAPNLRQYRSVSLIFYSTIETLNIDSSSFNSAGFAQNTFTNVNIQRSEFQIFDFTSTVQRSFEMDSCTFIKATDFTSAQFPHRNAVLPFAQFANKFAIQSDTITYFARNDTELGNDKKYNRLIALYTDFLALYKTRGDQESYNACYIEMKQVHTRRAGYLYRKAPTLETWFDWRINQLLEVFSDYGTNSAKGLIYIFYVIIGFAALYLIFPSEPDNLSRQTSFAFFDVVIGYFSTNTTLVNLRKHKRQRALDDLHNFQTTLAVSREDVPAFIAWLGQPLYGLNRAYLSASAWLVERFDIVPGRWQELSKGRKLWTSAAVGAYMLGFLAWGVIMRFVNAFALSINAFVTLGYGEIQARGVARYLAVLEGAVGWFLLSIFSVTLISQLLQ